MSGYWEDDCFDAAFPEAQQEQVRIERQARAEADLMAVDEAKTLLRQVYTAAGRGTAWAR